MGRASSKPESFESSTTSSPRSTDNSQKPSTDNDIHRLAIDQFAVVGSLYDAINDNVLQTPLPNISATLATLRATPYPVTETGILEGRNLFDLVRIDQELCLSIGLKIKASNGVSSLINSPFTTDNYTRFLSYYYPTQQIVMNDQQTTDKSKDIRKFLANIDATHVVTKIKSGIHVIVILQLSPKHVSELDRLLENIKNQLAANTFKIELNEEHLFDQFIGIRVFSNISDVTKLTKLADVCQKIIDIQSDSSQYRPLEYTLRPVRSVCSKYPPERAKYVQLDQKHMDQIEPYLSELLLLRKQLKILLNSAMEHESIENYFKQQFDDVIQQKSIVEDLYGIRIDRYCNMIISIRRGDVDQDALSKPLIDTDDRKLLTETGNVIRQLNVLMEKAKLINWFNTQGIEYWNVKELITKDENNWQTIERTLLRKGGDKRIFCFDDKLEKRSSSHWDDLNKRLTNGRKATDLIYADFSFCSYQLAKVKILSSDDISGPKKSSSEVSSSEATASSSKKPRLEESNPPIDNCINVLLLGESGVGKSTFINAIVNYLRFESLKQARAGKPVALMPVSFLLTVGDQFEERIVRFGDEDPNENHHHPGQSVTQNCRSYVFTIGTLTKIRFIDTPGMGDTRGLDQDDLNMQHILSFINNLSHLNAICILLKPNESRLNVVFRSYFTRLLGFLGESVRNNIIFCFTNTRSTFFAPGNTGPLLKKMLESHSMKDIPFKKTNTFCFDSESFRYLIARQNGIEFDDYQKEEYQRSWVSSVNESTRLLQYLCTSLKPYSQDDWQSIEHAQCQINQIIRPILETIRNIMRNIILLEKTSSNSLIKLQPKPVAKNSTICLGCTRSLARVGEFGFLHYEPHVPSDPCDTCPCDFSCHIKVDYVLNYEVWNDKQKPTLDEMKAKLDRVRRMIMDFASFLKYVARISKENDPILSNLNRIIAEENYICTKKKNKSINSFLYDELNNLKKDYDKIWTTSSSSRKPVTLPEIYKIIKKASETNMISEQIAAIKQTQETYMNEQEKQVT